MMKILYTSGEVHKAIKQILANGQQRRVAVVAYVGKNAEAFLPNPRGMTIICSPQPGATSPQSIRSLIGRGADVRFSDDLHAKVYWSEDGCVITSANASSSALGRSSQKEAGVLINSADFDIERLIHEIKPYEITKGSLDRLEMRDRKIKRALGIKNENEIQKCFPEWYQTPYRESWKFGWWSDSDLTAAKNAIERAEREYNVAEPEGVLNAAEGQVREFDWLLCFEVTARGIRRLEWMFADFIVPVSRQDKYAFEKENPFQVVQAHNLSRYPTPPFALDAPFRKAFAAAIKSYGIDKVMNSMSLVPKKAFLVDLMKRLEREGSA